MIDQHCGSMASFVGFQSRADGLVSTLSAQGGEGAEYYVLAFALALVLLSQGGGAFSLDRLLFPRKPVLNTDTLR